ncbi:hypothetical protein PFTANZ_06451 [Plasmodium falciparum Tanzania (2000708)]|uniref:Uncharacterized protein n=1 Tax=Plasmodium falciparum Tanzania (2000708) TaxID=1036725 RepID=A0A024VX63_PLAFA|nr:hypothetical protein PFTANZ_06451 [Plasmodium falciparum Tanzania (2000708)]
MWRKIKIKDTEVQNDEQKIDKNNEEDIKDNVIEDMNKEQNNYNKMFKVEDNIIDLDYVDLSNLEKCMNEEDTNNMDEDEKNNMKDDINEEQNNIDEIYKSDDHVVNLDNTKKDVNNNDKSNVTEELENMNYMKTKTEDDKREDMEICEVKENKPDDNQINNVQKKKKKKKEEKRRKRAF